MRRVEVISGPERGQRWVRPCSFHRLLPLTNSPDKSNALPEQSANEPLFLSIVADRSSRGVDAARQRGFRNDPPTPNARQQVVLAHRSGARRWEELGRYERSRTARVMTTLTRNGQDRRSENPLWVRRRKSARKCLGPISGSHQGRRPQRPHSQAGYIAAPERFAQSRIPLAQRGALHT
jgi:hypothetical protein